MENLSVNSLVKITNFCIGTEPARLNVLLLYKPGLKEVRNSVTSLVLVMNTSIEIVLVLIIVLYLTLQREKLLRTIVITHARQIITTIGTNHALMNVFSLFSQPSEAVSTIVITLVNLTSTCSKQEFVALVTLQT